MVGAVARLLSGQRTVVFQLARHVRCHGAAIGSSNRFSWSYQSLPGCTALNWRTQRCDDRELPFGSALYQFAAVVVAATAATAVLVPSEKAARCEPESVRDKVGGGSRNKGEVPFDAAVIIVGAGFAGVSAARELRFATSRRHGSNALTYCLVLEGRGRVGGRSFSTEWDGHTVELGGHYVHWWQPHIWGEIHRYRQEVVEASGASSGFDKEVKTQWEDSDGVWRTGTDEELYTKMQSLNKEFWAPLKGLFDIFHKPLLALEEGASSEAAQRLRRLDLMTAQQRVDEMAPHITGEELNLLIGWWEGCACAPLSDCSFAALARHWGLIAGKDWDLLVDTTSRFKLQDGTGALVNAMLQDADCEVRLDTAVEQIMQDDHGVTVVTANGDQLRSEAVVVTAPLNALKGIEFMPPVSEERRAALTAGQATCGFQVMIKVRGLKGSFYAISAHRQNIQWLATEWCNSDGTHVLVGYGVNARHFDVHNKDAVQREVTRFCGEGVEVVDTFAWNWLGDEFSRGTWTNLRPGQLTESIRPMQQREGRVFFAGDYLADGWNGFMDGAIESGIKTGREVVEFLNISRRAQL